MGDLVSKTIHHYPNGLAQNVTEPQERNWITKHAELTGLSIVEVERVWKRFQQLECDEDGVLSTAFISGEASYKVSE